MGQQPMVSPAEDKAMARAIELAARGLGATSPNPVFGCVILNGSGQVVGEGFHAYAGGPHAEIVALAQAGEKAKGGTAVVTLEPCNHTGRTGPCSEALVRAGVARVVIAVVDPNPLAAGGAQTLRDAGVEVIVGVRAAEAEDGNIAWLTSVRRGRPYLIWKTAATMDGRAAAADGSSMWITSEAARMDVHRLRGTVDAIMIGVGTVLAEDPRLTARDLRTGSLAIRQPLRVVIDSHGRTPADARVRDSAAPTLIATTALLGAGPDGRLDLRAVLRELHHRGIRSVLLEGGPHLAGAFLAAGLVDLIVSYVAPKLLGDGPAALVGAGVTTVTDAIDLEVLDVDRVGPDLRLTARPRVSADSGNL
ncbi:putative bifunctional riboflavin biosynthesis protein RibG [Catellatospora sp. TT07R-123]|uniref:bifunctional diaminohydroxyphosphoribosylaminopyrimidine deaminase/5-amino-6-(5-phosphoribosylamino)uracil reductase RibD n=1 Tax=Catellatospora sp. TT07R-123 TaxID=2733863 RepID=UPI001B1A321A|nr:putative bifunctional riboflavin biosynthesis protein RibG [Catellatospora sp. TT07R-123]